MSIEVHRIDAFTSEPFKGNPAAVCRLDGPADEGWMRNVAKEMNLSETAFFYPIDGGYHLRWFTPKAEVDLCGHATLATAYYLFENEVEPVDKPVRFNTRSGWVSAVPEGDWIVMDFPANPPQQIEEPQRLAEALGVQAISYVGAYPKAYLVEVADDSVVRSLKPDMQRIQQFPVQKICVTASDSTGHADIVSRLFAPAIGIYEDPVNGNSHTALAPYWSQKLGKTELLSHYASQRGGEVRVHHEGDRVRIAGQAVTSLAGHMVR
jgi:PhzF family phenazine biosynthesis protein